MVKSTDIKNLISDWKDNWARLDLLNFWALTNIADRNNLEKYLRNRWEKNGTVLSEKNEIIEDFLDTIKNLGIASIYPYTEDVQNVSVGDYITRIMNEECGKYFEQDAEMKIKSASETQKKLLYIFAKMIEKGKTSGSDLPPYIEKLYEATYGATISSEDCENFFESLGIYCVRTSSKKHSYWEFKVPLYVKPLLRNIEKHITSPKLFDIETYVKKLSEERNIPRLVLFDIITKATTQGENVIRISPIKDVFEYAYPNLFEKYSSPTSGMISKDEYYIAVSPVTVNLIKNSICNIKKELLQDLYSVFTQILEKLKETHRPAQYDLYLDEKLMAYVGFADIGTVSRLNIVICPWIVFSKLPPASYYGGIIQNFEGDYSLGKTPCLIVTKEELNISLIRLLERKKVKNIYFLSIPDTGEKQLYVFGEKHPLLGDIERLLADAGHDIKDVTGKLRDKMFPSTKEYVKNFANMEYTREQLLSIARECSISIPSTPYHSKDEVIEKFFSEVGLSSFAEKIGYPTKIPEKVKELPKKVEEKRSISEEVISKPVPKGVIWLGKTEEPKQWGVIGKTADDRLVSVDLNEPHIGFVCGKMGSGKGYTIGVLCEMLASHAIKNISNVIKPATIIVLYKPKDDVRSEFWSIRNPNNIMNEVEGLKEYSAHPEKLVDETKLKVFLDPTVYANPKDKDIFTSEYATNNVAPIYIAPSSLTAEDWANALATGGSRDALYIKKIFKILRTLTAQLHTFGLNDVRRGIGESNLTEGQKGWARSRLEILEEYLKDDDFDFINKLVLGGVNIFDFRKCMYLPDDIFTIMTLIISRLQNKKELEDEPFVFIMNEAHEYFKTGISKDFVETIENLIRRKRHRGNWLLLDTHFPDDVDQKVIKCSDIKVLHFTDITVRSEIVRDIIEKSADKLYKLKVGEAVICSDQSSEGLSKAIKVKIRPRITLHGAPTKATI